MKKLFRKLRDLLFRKRTRGTVWGQKFDNECVTKTGRHCVSPECFRKQFEEAYPDGAAFLDSIKKMRDKSGNEFYNTTKGLISDAFICAKGSNP